MGWWSPHKIDWLRHLQSKGYSDCEIAVKMGTTRNKVEQVTIKLRREQLAKKAKRESIGRKRRKAQKVLYLFAAKPTPQQRQCIMCRRSFQSQGAHNRRCDDCTVAIQDIHDCAVIR